MKGISGAMNQTICGAVNGRWYAPPNGNKHKLIPCSQWHAASLTGTYRSVLLVHHLHFMSTSTLRQEVAAAAGTGHRLLAAPSIGPRRGWKHGVNLLQVSL